MKTYSTETKQTYPFHFSGKKNRYYEEPYGFPGVDLFDAPAPMVSF